MEFAHGNLKFNRHYGCCGRHYSQFSGILCLSCFLAAGLQSSFDTVAVFIGVLALLTLVQFKVGVIPVISACGAIGIALNDLSYSVIDALFHPG
ncbi:MAG: hypothetical protein ABL887_09740 [Nitrosomonas sp.]